MLAFPVASFVRFCHNHGLLQINDRPQWHTVNGGARRYVDKLLATIPTKYLHTPVQSVTRSALGTLDQVIVKSRIGVHLYDHAVMASHGDQTLRLLHDATSDEQRLLSAIRYQPNRAVLHTDTSCLPDRRKTWSAWNYQSQGGEEPKVCVHYLINQLQPLPFKTPVIVSLNPMDEPHPSTVIDSFDYAHPVFDGAAIAAQRQLSRIQGKRNTWFAGAWTGYGFHEDGLTSGLAVARAIMQLQSGASLDAAA
jgi:predicted NAD/FAD-binding protein